MKDIALHILDIAQNSISAGSNKIFIEISENPEEDKLILTIIDNGRGMDKEKVLKVTDPWFTTRTTRKVGMGIPLLKHNAEQAGGAFFISSAPGEGTRLTAIFGLSNIDRPPFGDIPGVVSLLAGANPSLDFIYRYSEGEREYIFDTREIKEVLEDVPLSEPAVIRYMKEMLEENLKIFSENPIIPRQTK